MDASDRIVAQAHQRIHAANLKGNNLLTVRNEAGIKLSVQDAAAKTINIITANKARVRKDILAWVPNIETI